MEKTADKEVKKAKKADKGPKMQTKTDTSKFYELGYILVPSLDQASATKEMDRIGELFTSRGGQYISGEMPVLIDLEYQMVKVIHAHREKCDQGYFGWMKFEIETEAINEIKKALDLSDSMLRYLLIKTVGENTLLNGKMSLALGDDKRKGFDDVSEEEIEAMKEEAPVEVNQEELDKSIDDLVIA
jgi:ribosomal protein S6